jgi:pimeloyl-ACP methyl ester carboxylesterase
VATVGVRDIDIHYETFGNDGPPLIVAHGLMGSVELAKILGDPMEAIAAKGVRVIAYDARGHGRSGYTRRRQDYTWSALAEDMYAFVRALGLERASICGGSMGAGAALVLALDHPEIVDKLILRAPPPLGNDMKAIQPWFAALAMMFRVLGPSLTGQVLAMSGRDERGEARPFFGAQRRASIVPAIEGVIFGDPLPMHRFEKIAQPTHPPLTGTILHETLRHARLAEAPSQTYWRENAAALAHVIAAFVKGEEIARGLPAKHVHGAYPA